MSERRKELKRAYQQSHAPLGVFQIRCLVNEKVLVGSTLNLPGIFNRYKFQLQAGTHQNQALQADWNRFGEAGFAFEVLDELTPQEDPTHDYSADLAFLEECWLEQLQPYDERGYNELKKSREQKLQQIAARRRQYF
jgi:hypothetical protein